MKNNKIGVGIVGASKGSWAFRAHLPALKMMHSLYFVAAVSTSNMESARETAAMFDIPGAYDNINALLRDADVDLVVIAVKVPSHFELVSAALNAGKAVYCEWPLGNGVDEAIGLLELARVRNSRTFAGLQALANPELRYLKDLIGSGTLGQVISTTLIGSGGIWGNVPPKKSDVYMLDPKNGATMLQIPFGHSIAGLTYLLGDFTDAQSLLVNNYKEIFVPDVESVVSQGCDDHIALSGTLTSGAFASVTYRGGSSKGVNFYWEIKCAGAEIIITSPSGHLQFGKLKMEISKDKGDLKAIELPAGYYESNAPQSGETADISYSVYYAYQRIADDLLQGTHLFPDFEAGVKHHLFLEKVKAHY